jgi:hypothetical protein
MAGRCRSTPSSVDVTSWASSPLATQKLRREPGRESTFAAGEGAPGCRSAENHVPVAGGECAGSAGVSDDALNQMRAEAAHIAHNLVVVERDGHPDRRDCACRVVKRKTKQLVFPQPIGPCTPSRSVLRAAAEDARFGAGAPLIVEQDVVRGHVDVQRAAVERVGLEQLIERLAAYTDVVNVKRRAGRPRFPGVCCSSVSSSPAASSWCIIWLARCRLRPI